MTKQNNLTRVQLMNTDPNLGRQLLVNTEELDKTFTELYNWFLRVQMNQGQVYTTKLSNECTLMALQQMNNSGLFN